MGICAIGNYSYHRSISRLACVMAMLWFASSATAQNTQPATQPSAANAAQTTNGEPLPGGKKPDYSYRHPGIAGRCVMYVAKDTNTLYFSPAKGKVLALGKPKGSGTNQLLQFMAANPKVKFKPDDILLIQSSLPLWDSVMVNLGFTDLPTGLAYKVEKEGTGKLPEKGKRVQVHYRGYFMDGKEFDNSFKRGQPIDIVLGAGQVIKGWDEGIGLFKVGSKGTLRIPYGMAYGDRGIPGVIPPKSTLFFDIEVVSAD